MKRFTSITTACVFAVLAAFATQLGAQQPDTLDRTFLTFDSSVELPGVTLQPGTYEFRLADTPSRNVVQVFRKDDSKPMGQWTFAQAERERTSEDTVVMFREAPEGQTPAVQFWYAPGEKVGKEFIYPKDQAERIAARTGREVLSDGGRVKSDARADASNAPAAASTSAAASSGQPSVNAGASVSSSSTASTPDLRNAPANAQPSAPAGSTAGNRGVPDTTQRTDAAPAASTSTPDLRNAPANAQPSAPAGSTAGNRGVPNAAQRADAAPAPDANAGAAADRDVTATERIQAPAAQARVDADLEPAPRPVGTSGSAQADTQAAQGQVARAELPSTASPLALTALIGILSLAGAAGMRYLRH